MNQTINSILENEFKKITKQELSKEELVALYDYLDYCDNGELLVDDLQGLVYSFVQDCYYYDQLYNSYELFEWMDLPFVRTEVKDGWFIKKWRGCSVMTPLKQQEA